MLEVLIAVALAAGVIHSEAPLIPAQPVIPEAPKSVTVIDRISICQARAGGIADALSSAKHGDFVPLQQTGILVNPKSLDEAVASNQQRRIDDNTRFARSTKSGGDGCVVAITDDVHSVEAIQGIEKITGIGPTRFAVVWRSE